jgi:hypothetical protein
MTMEEPSLLVPLWVAAIDPSAGKIYTYILPFHIMCVCFFSLPACLSVFFSCLNCFCCEQPKNKFLSSSEVQGQKKFVLILALQALNLVFYFFSCTENWDWNGQSRCQQLAASWQISHLMITPGASMARSLSKAPHIQG